MRKLRAWGRGSDGLRGVRCVTIAGLLLLESIPRIVEAQGNYRSAPTGGRSALMGNTGIALGNDGAAAFLNPATMVHVDSALALMLNFVSLDLVHIGGYYMPGPVDTGKNGNVPKSDAADITRISGNAVPSTFCLFAGLPRIGSAKEGQQGDQKVAACLGATERQSFDWVGQGYQATGPDRGTMQASSVRRSWQRFVVAPTYAVQITDDLAIGASTHATFSDYSSFTSVGTTTSGRTLPATASAFQTGASGSAVGLSVLLGATLTFGRVAIGLSLQSPDVSTYGHASANSYVQLAGASGISSSTYLGAGTFSVVEPTRIAMGYAYHFPTGTVELDLRLALAQNEAVVLETTGTAFETPAVANVPATRRLSTRYEPTVNLGIGGEIFVRSNLSLLGGFGTDFSAVSTIGPTTAACDKVNRLFWSLGASAHSAGGTVLVGAQLYYGWGDTLAPNVYRQPPVLVPTEMKTFGVLLVFAGATSFSALKQAIAEVQHVIVPNKAGH